MARRGKICRVFAALALMGLAGGYVLVRHICRVRDTDAVMREFHALVDEINTYVSAHGASFHQIPPEELAVLERLSELGRRSRGVYFPLSESRELERIESALYLTGQHAANVPGMAPLELDQVHSFLSETWVIGKFFDYPAASLAGPHAVTQSISGKPGLGIYIRTIVARIIALCLTGDTGRARKETGDLLRLANGAGHGRRLFEALQLETLRLAALRCASFVSSQIPEDEAFRENILASSRGYAVPLQRLLEGELIYHIEIYQLNDLAHVEEFRDDFEAEDVRPYTPYWNGFLNHLREPLALVQRGFPESVDVRDLQTVIEIIKAIQRPECSGEDDDEHTTCVDSFGPPIPARLFWQARRTAIEGDVLRLLLREDSKALRRRGAEELCRMIRQHVPYAEILETFVDTNGILSIKLSPDLIAPSGRMEEPALRFALDST